MPRPRDVIVEGPEILFVGINPGLVSGKTGHHFAGGNEFWKLLHAAGLTPELLTSEDDHRLSEWQLALVNLVPRPTKVASELKRAELLAGQKALVKKVTAMQPRIVALVGVTLYPVVFARDERKQPKPELPPGPGPKPQVIAGAHVFVLPNPSGLNASFPTFEAKLPWFVALRGYLDKLEPRA
jgi:TDG/mug DNA glycosylase family protein